MTSQYAFAAPAKKSKPACRKFQRRSPIALFLTVVDSIAGA
jgi:hypothetical protein